MVCASCGASNPDQTRFCGQCGGGLPESDDTLTTAMGDFAAARQPLARAAQAAAGVVTPPPDASQLVTQGMVSPLGVRGTSGFPPGSLFGTRYRIESLLGEGGMGAVYKAYDGELDRFIALKLVRPEMATSPETMARFKQELLLASRISQKNVLRIHDLGDWNGIKFITMAFVEGTDLAGLLEKTGCLPLDRALKFTRQLCAALEAAHSEDVVHRDLKPQNILVDASDNLYVSDFGLAKSLEAEATMMTRTGQILGTPRYMSPEQVEARNVDHRSDIYSLGLIIYEIFTGALPFRGESAMQLMYQRVTSAPDDPRKICPDLPDYIARVILKCLSKNPADRYQSAREILNDLDSQTAPVSSIVSSVPSPGARTISVQFPRPTRRFGMIATGVAALVVALLFLIPATRREVLGLLPGAASNAPGAAVIEHYLAVLPLGVSGDDGTLRYVADGVGDAISAKLSGLRNVYVASANTLGPALAQKTDQKIAQALGVAILIKGNVQTAGDKISITLTMYDVNKNRTLLHHEFPGVREDLLTLEDQIFNSITESLLIRQSNEEKTRTTTRPTDNIEAYEFYLKGRNLVNGPLTTANMDAALKLFDQAIAKDPTFALAYAGSADAYLQSWKLTKDGLLAQRALGAAQQAERLNDSLPEVHFSLGSIYTNTGRTAEAIVELRRAMQLDPNSDDALRRLGMAYRSVGQSDQAIAAGTQATQINPYLWVNYNSLGATYFALGQNQKALEAFKKVTDLAPGIPNGWANLGAVYYRMAQWSACIPAFQKAIEIEAKPLYHSQLGVAYFFLGRYKEAAGMFETAVQKDPKDSSFEVNLADAYRWSNQRDKAAKAYDQAIALAYKALEVNPKNANALADLAIAYAKKGDALNAAKFIRQARQIQPGNNGYMYREATIHTLAGEFREAAASLGDALRSGYSLEEAKADPELKPLRDRPEFDQLLKVLVPRGTK